MMASICRAALVLSSLLLVLSLLFWQPTSAEETSVKPKNLRYQLPKIFDWHRFKTSFQKVYPTIRDELARKKLFLASALQTFLHNLSFRWGKVKYFLSINQLSDSTPEELKKMYSGFRSDNYAGDESGSSANGQSDEMESAAGVDLERLEQMLARIVAEKQPGYRLLARQLRITIDNRRSKRDVGLYEQQIDEEGKVRSGKTKKRSRHQMSKSNKRNERRQRNSQMKINEFRSMITGEQPKESKKLVKRVPSTNPEHSPLELFSQAAKTNGNEDSLPEQQLKLLEIVPNSVDYVKRQFNWLTYTFKKITSDENGDGDDSKDLGSGNQDDSDAEEQKGDDGEYYSSDDEDVDEESDNNPAAKRARLGYLSDVSDGSQTKDQVYLDYREDGCLTVPRNQGKKCGSCYAFALVSLMEWVHCNQTGKLVPFSEQYIIDCGKHVEAQGCNGSGSDSMERFMRDWGVELRVDYPYLERESLCPFEKEDWHRAGYKRPVVLKYERELNRALWPTILKMSGPQLAFLKIPKDFAAYGGLVHPGHNCKEGPGLHAMLLVGHGIEDGEEYWLLRNSHSYLWGEEGYFKLSKGAQNECFRDFQESKMDFIRPPIEPIEITEKIGDETKVRILTPYEADQEGLIRY